MSYYNHITYYFFITIVAFSVSSDDCLKEGILSKEKLTSLTKDIVFDLNLSSKGEAGKIAVIGGSTEYTGAPYFAAITSLKVGADLVYVITTENAAPVIKSYSPDLIVYPFLNKRYASKITTLLQKMDVVIIGPGLGRDDEQIKFILDIISTCKNLDKPLVIDADGLYALTTNVSVLTNYKKPGVILTPNSREAAKLKEAVTISNSSLWYNYWGENVSVLIKGISDNCYAGVGTFNWSLLGGGSDRRASGQGDILAGALGTFYNWSLKSKLCRGEHSTQLAKSVAIYAAAKFTRTCNALAFVDNGRNMIASDMLKKIHPAFNEVFK